MWISLRFLSSNGLLVSQVNPTPLASSSPLPISVPSLVNVGKIEKGHSLQSKHLCPSNCQPVFWTLLDITVIFFYSDLKILDFPLQSPLEKALGKYWLQPWWYSRPGLIAHCFFLVLHSHSKHNIHTWDLSLLKRAEACTLPRISGILMTPVIRIEKPIR